MYERFGFRVLNRMSHPIIDLPQCPGSGTPRSAQPNVDKPASAGMLQEETYRQRDRVYVAAETVRIPEEQKQSRNGPECRMYRDGAAGNTEPSHQRGDRSPGTPTPSSSPRLKEVAEGAVLGAFAGDAAGASLEFSHGRLTSEQVQHAISMVGGGPHRTAPGQITDDGEMALSLMHALAGETSFDIEAVAKSYFRWYSSGPFDIGRTTSDGLRGGGRRTREGIHIGMWEAAQEHNTHSKANGSLMRIAPLGVWGHRLSEEAVVEAARQDSRLTHSNHTCQAACAVYAVAMRHLMIRPGDADAAFETATRWAARLQNRETIRWLDDATNGMDVGYQPNIGFVKYGFTHAFRHLKARTPYKLCLVETLRGGGDTDTNACIVGGMIGALHGGKGIPEEMKRAVLGCDTHLVLQPGSC